MKEYTETLRLHGLWVRGVPDGVRANLRGANLRGANLRDADLRRANLWGADLRGADLRGANLEDANLRDADLRRANLEDANLRDADLRRANLRRANLRGANLRGAAGNLREVKSLFIETYPVTYTSEVLQIGCERHAIDDWRGFDGRRILEMDGEKAAQFWGKWKAHIFTTIEISPASPTKTEAPK
ncbi:pentapeptide repeat-containing protein [bacterium]|nr:pentapeptide repeat-containing protein [bacterium]